MQHHSPRLPVRLKSPAAISLAERMAGTVLFCSALSMAGLDCGRWRRGWYFASDEPFAWAVYHYGRWYDDGDLGWCWVPGNVWAPAWVSWRDSDDYVGWAPLPPENDGFSIGFQGAVQEPPRIGRGRYAATAHIARHRAPIHPADTTRVPPPMHGRQPFGKTFRLRGRVKTHHAALEHRGYSATGENRCSCSARWQATVCGPPRVSSSGRSRRQRASA
ncbi:MAG: DUF6600 domain-containing protein [Devosia sp.]